MVINDLRDRLQNRLQRDENWVKFALSFEGVLIILLIVSTIYLSLYILQHQAPQESAKSQTTQAVTTTPTIPPSPSPTPSPTPLAKTTPIPANGVKEYFVPLGSGSSTASDWTDVPGVVTSLDFGQYQHIKDVHFEASIYVPTANESVSVRLYNVTDKHPVWYSEITMSGGSSAYLTSPAISYDSGTKLYQVQMKTQLQAQANLVQSKIHVTIQ